MIAAIVLRALPLGAAAGPPLGFVRHDLDGDGREDMGCADIFRARVSWLGGPIDPRDEWTVDIVWTAGHGAVVGSDRSQPAERVRERADDLDPKRAIGQHLPTTRGGQLA